MRTPPPTRRCATAPSWLRCGHGSAAPAGPPKARPPPDGGGGNRPELASLGARLGGADAAVSLARSAYWPDVGVMVQYQNMLPMPEDHFMVGVSLNVPLQLGRRSAAVD